MQREPEGRLSHARSFPSLLETAKTSRKCLICFSNETTRNVNKSRIPLHSTYRIRTRSQEDGFQYGPPLIGSEIIDEPFRNGGILANCSVTSEEEPIQYLKDAKDPRRHNQTRNDGYEYHKSIVDLSASGEHARGTAVRGFVKPLLDRPSVLQRATKGGRRQRLHGSGFGCQRGAECRRSLLSCKSSV